MEPSATPRITKLKGPSDLPSSLGVLVFTAGAAVAEVAAAVLEVEAITAVEAS